MGDAVTCRLALEIPVPRFCKLMLFSLLVMLAANAVAAPSPAQRAERAAALAHQVLLADTHIDAPYRLEEDGWRDLSLATADRDFDLVKALRGGLDLAFMSIYTPSALDASGGNRAVADRLIDSVEAMVGRNPAGFVIVRTPEEAIAAKAGGKLALALGMENGAAIGDSLDGLRHFHARGVRYITLAHAMANRLADSSYDVEHRREGGLSPFGVEVVTEMNRLGVMVDVSHLSDDAVRSVLAASKAPVIASHSSARHFTPGWERNLSDALIDAIGVNGGVIQVTFGSGFVSSAANQWQDAQKAARKAAGIADAGADADAFDTAYRSAHPYPYATAATVADHIDYIAKRIGIDHVGLGSDFDGVGDSLPSNLKDVSQYPHLIAELIKRGFSDEQIAKIAGGNLLRVWAAVEHYAQTHQP